MKNLTAIVSVSALLFFLYSNTGTTTLSADASIYSIKLKNFSKSVYSEKRTKYILSSTDPHFSLPNTPFQRVTSGRKNDGKYFLTIITGKIKRKPEPGVSRSYLQNTRFLNLESREIRHIKNRFSRSKNKISEIKNFVYRYINNKVLGIPIISAEDILKNRSGDCTEHTILTIALLRSLKIPSRAAVGMLLCREFKGMHNVFVFHMWAEAFIGKRWVLVDSSNPGPRKHNRYIAFAYHHLKTEMPLSYLKAVSAIKNLTAEYSELQ